MTVSALGYLGVRTARLSDWADFSTNLLGMQQVDKGGSVHAFRMDDRKQRLILGESDAEGLDFMGWEVPDAASLDQLASRLENHGVAVTLAPMALADQRHVARLIWFLDPDGNRVELFCGPETASTPFTPGRPISGFRTGAMGMGHAVLHSGNVESLLTFYRDLLGFQVTDYGLTPYPLYFFHVNARHHSFALVGSGRKGLHHFMIETTALDDVGQGYDLAMLEAGRVVYTLGRHANDSIISFYVNTPSGFFVEYGWGSPAIDPASWTAVETTEGPSLWGHDRLYLPEDSPTRRRLKDMALETGRRGRRAPNPVCQLLDGVIGRE